MKVMLLDGTLQPLKGVANAPHIPANLIQFSVDRLTPLHILSG
jgi:hypothetical protein